MLSRVGAYSSHQSQQGPWEGLCAEITWIPASVGAMGELFGDQVSKAANILFPLGFSSSHLFHKIPVTKIPKLQYLHLVLLLVQETREALKAAPE